MQKYSILTVGIIVIAIGGFLFYKSADLAKKCTEEVTATVVDIEEETEIDEDGTSYIYYPVVEYKAGDENVKAKMTTGSSSPKYKIKDKVTILYNPNKTDEFIVKGDGSMDILKYIFVVVGVALTGYGVFVALKKETPSKPVEFHQ